MGKLVTREQITQFIKEEGLTSVADVQAALKEVFAETLQAMLEAELTHSLGYAKHAPTAGETPNRRNGHSRKRVRSEYGAVDLAIPRDRAGDFDPLVVKKHQTNVTGIEDQILALYAKGVSTRDIQDHLQRLYGLEVSPTLISQVTNQLLPIIQAWQSRPLAGTYAMVFLDAIHYKVRQEHAVVTKAAYVVLGIDLEGRKDVLGLWVGEHESATFWLGVLTELRSRGVQDLLLVSVDNLTGFSEAIAACFPLARIQKCVVHQIRASMRYVADKDMKPVAAALKPIYTAPSETAALAALDVFAERWGAKYPWCVKSWRANWPELATCLSMPPEVRKLIYTTNLIESYHRQLRKATKGKAIFPTDEALVKQLYLVTQDVTRKWTMRIAHWGQILLQLAILFPGRVPDL